MATYVLIPGAASDSWYWHLVVPELGRVATTSWRPTCRATTTRPASPSTRTSWSTPSATGDRSRARGAVAGWVHRPARVRPGAGRPAGAGRGDVPRPGETPRRLVGEHRPGARRSESRPRARARPRRGSSTTTRSSTTSRRDVAAESADQCAPSRAPRSSAVAAATVARGAHPVPAVPRTTGCSPPTSSAASCATAWGSRPTRWTAATCPPSPTPTELAERLEAFRTEASSPVLAG